MKKLVVRSGFALMFCLLSFVSSSSLLGMKKEDWQNNNSKDKRVDLLEKLEKGDVITSEEISGSLGSLNVNPHNSDDNYSSWSPEFYFVPPFPPVPLLPGPFYYRYDDDYDHSIISDEDIREIHHQISKSMDELRRNLESFRNSEEFMKFHKELQKWNESFRKDLDKMKEEWKKEDKEAKNSNPHHINM